MAGIPFLHGSDIWYPDTTRRRTLPSLLFYVTVPGAMVTCKRSAFQNVEHSEVVICAGSTLHEKERERLLKGA